MSSVVILAPWTSDPLRSSVRPLREARGQSGSGDADDMSWAMEHITSEQSEIMYEGIWRGASTAVVGRVNWEGFTSVWPGLTSDPTSSARTRELGNWLATVDKVVTSTTLQQTDLDKTEWANARVSRDLEAEVRSLKAAPGRDILVLGSASIIKALLPIPTTGAVALCHRRP
ncbi:dihydrofolate reductase family protein [Streptomyces venezuelae]|uniref:dihydrofolate reductase family protein n=1 Tax=Streptomyces venezuelae TaxID=54571 RepID=UPI0037B19491